MTPESNSVATNYIAGGAYVGCSGSGTSSHGCGSVPPESCLASSGSPVLLHPLSSLLTELWPGVGIRSSSLKVLRPYLAFLQ